ncbi:MAG: hypothetical protein KF760_27365 [Candidatus Eremiobacteraeota bacterium]|nr:hypothetical protein [Candidatus Eremiobacteraeota bacterium]MCW5869883.1 hypothetical protein [Candidatus Eremiobacteraeota bacterium]
MRLDQKMTVVHGVLCLTSLLLILQLWLLTATMNAYMGGDRAIIWPAFLASSSLLAFNLGLLRFLYRQDD